MSLNVMLAARQAREDFEDYCNAEFCKIDCRLKTMTDDLAKYAGTYCTGASGFYERYSEELDLGLTELLSIFGSNLAIDCEFNPCETAAMSKMAHHIGCAKIEVEELRKTLFQSVLESYCRLIRVWQKEEERRAQERLEDDLQQRGRGEKRRKGARKERSRAPQRIVRRAQQ